MAVYKSNPFVIIKNLVFAVFVRVFGGVIWRHGFIGRGLPLQYNSFMDFWLLCSFSGVASWR